MLILCAIRARRVRQLQAESLDPTELFAIRADLLDYVKRHSHRADEFVPLTEFWRINRYTDSEKVQILAPLFDEAMLLVPGSTASGIFEGTAEKIFDWFVLQLPNTVVLAEREYLQMVYSGIPATMIIERLDVTGDFVGGDKVGHDKVAGDKAGRDISKMRAGGSIIASAAGSSTSRADGARINSAPELKAEIDSIAEEVSAASLPLTTSRRY